jgi:hypothetical protein
MFWIRALFGGEAAPFSSVQEPEDLTRESELPRVVEFSQ